jgi:hypothetical protein
VDFRKRRAFTENIKQVLVGDRPSRDQPLAVAANILSTGRSRNGRMGVAMSNGRHNLKSRMSHIK